MPDLHEWFTVRYDVSAIVLQVNPPGAAAWQAQIDWNRIVRVCFEAGDWYESDVVYLFTDERPESYAVPIEADGGQALWFEILDRKLFDAEMAIVAATATNELFCSPPPDQQPGPALAPLTSPRQLPDLEGEKLILAPRDQLEADSIVLHGERVIWREKTGWEVYERFEEIAGIPQAEIRQAFGGSRPGTEKSLRAVWR